MNEFFTTNTIEQVKKPETFSLITYNPDIAKSTSLAYDFKFFKRDANNHVILPKVGDILSIKRFKGDSKGKAIKNRNGQLIFLGTISFRVDEPPFIDWDDEADIRLNPKVPSQVNNGNPGNMVHRIVFPSVSLKIGN